MDPATIDLAAIEATLDDEARGWLATSAMLPRPPSGLPPLVPTFADIADGAWVLDGAVRRVGGGPGRPVWAETHRDAAGRDAHVVPLDVPNENGELPCYRLVSMEAAVDRARAAGHPVSDGWLERGSRQLVLVTDEIVTVRQPPLLHRAPSSRAPSSPSRALPPRPRVCAPTPRRLSAPPSQIPGSQIVRDGGIILLPRRMQYLGRHEFPTVRARQPRTHPPSPPSRRRPRRRRPRRRRAPSHVAANTDARPPSRALLVLQAWRALECVLVSEELVAIQEPVTWIDAKDMLVSVATNVAYGNVSDEQEILANEARSQLVPEHQQNFYKAYFILRGFSLARFLKIAGGKEKWRGDRSLTLDLEIEDEEHFGEIFGQELAHGWMVGKLDPTVNGRKRPRKRGHGYLLPFFHEDVDGGDTNKISFNLELKRLTGCLSLGYFGLNLQFIRGVPPPACPPSLADRQPAWDIVSGEWVPREGEGAVVLTAARAHAHFRAGFVADA